MRPFYTVLAMGLFTTTLAFAEPCTPNQQPTTCAAQTQAVRLTDLQNHLLQPSMGGLQSMARVMRLMDCQPAWHSETAQHQVRPEAFNPPLLKPYKPHS